jgi:hypothetical protein
MTPNFSALLQLYQGTAGFELVVGDLMLLTTLISRDFLKMTRKRTERQQKN